MAYAEFTLENAVEQLGLAPTMRALFENVEMLEPSPWLQKTLSLYRGVALLNEKTRSEFLVAPILAECRERSGNKFSLFSGVRLDIDPERGLIGECDFVLSLSPPLPLLQAPIAVVLEAKRGDIELSLGQCVAQIVGARVFNEKKDGRNGVPIFGCVTTGQEWQFMRLDDYQLTIDTNRYYLLQLPLILGIFQAMLASCGVDTAAA